MGKLSSIIMQVWHAVRDRCDNLCFQVHPRSVNFDCEIAATWLYFVRRFRRSQSMHAGFILVKRCGGRYSAFVCICAFVFLILLCNVCNFRLLHIYMVSLWIWTSFHWCRAWNLIRELGLCPSVLLRTIFTANKDFLVRNLDGSPSY